MKIVSRFKTVLELRGYLLLLCLILVGCKGDVATVKIGVLVNPDEPSDRSMLLALRLVETELNDRLLKDAAGKPYQLDFIEKDIGQSQETALKALHELVREHQPIALLGPTTSHQALPVSNDSNQLKIPLLTPSASNPLVTENKPYVFSAVYSNIVQSKALAHFVEQQLEVKRIGVLFQASNLYSRDLAENFRRSLQDRQKSIVFFQGYATSEESFSTYLQNAKTEDVELLFLPNFDQDIDKQIQLIERMDWNVSILGSDSWYPERILKRNPKRPLYFSHLWGVSVADKNPQAQAYINAFETQFHSKPTIISALAYDSIHMLLNAIANGNQNRQRLRDALANTNQFPGVCGTYSFEQGSTPKKPVYIFSMNQNSISLHAEVQVEK